MKHPNNYKWERKANEKVKKLTIMFKFPETKPVKHLRVKIFLNQKGNVRFSRMHPSGISMRCPSLAITKTYTTLTTCSLGVERTH